MSRSRVHWNETIFLSLDSQKIFIKGRHTTFPVTFWKYFRQVETTPTKILSKSCFTPACRILKEKIRKWSVTRSRNTLPWWCQSQNTILTGIMQWPFLTLAIHFLLKIDHPLTFQSKTVADEGLNIPEICKRLGI